MPRRDGRLEPGQPLNGAISAGAWNRMMDAADVVMGDRYGFAGGRATAGNTPYTWVYAKPSATVARWGVLAITGVEITPTSSDSDSATVSFQDQPVVTCDTPSATTTAWGVAVEPIESGKIGRLAVGGVVQVKAADLGKAAGATVLWKDSTWALVRFGSGIVRGTFTGNWSKGSTATVTDAVTSSKTYTVKNYIASLATSGTVTCSIAQVGDEWILVSWDWHSLSGYSGSAQQVLAHNASGQLTWLNTTGCT